MIGIFSKKWKIRRLDAEYKKLMHQAFLLSTKNRRLSDEATAKANDIQKLIIELETKM
jgi:hypothetical protein|tara:strand:+ start:387 stop:560 length:174 start_codon:yes stop_codon:yes gene_type:complete